MSCKPSFSSLGYYDSISLSFSLPVSHQHYPAHPVVVLLSLPRVQPGAAALFPQQPHPATEGKVMHDLIVHLDCYMTAPTFLCIEEMFFFSVHRWNVVKVQK